MQEGSVFKIFSNSTVTFRKSFWGLLATYWFALLALVIVSLVVGKCYSIPWNLKNPLETIRLLQVMSTTAYAILGLLFYIGGFVFTIWQVLIIKNNLFDGESRLFPTFKESIGKAILISFCTLILLAIFVPLGLFIKEMFPVGLKFTPIIMLFFTPIFLIFYMGLILQEGKLKEVISFSFKAALYGYFNTLVAILIFILAETLVGLLLVGLFFFLRLAIIFTALSLFLIIIALPLMYLVLQCFAMVFYVETYYSVAVGYENMLEAAKAKKIAAEDKKEKQAKKEVETAENDTQEKDVLADMHLLGEETKPTSADDSADNNKGNKVTPK